MLDLGVVKQLVTAISEGRATLLIGQDHTDGLVDTALKEASSLLASPVSSLKAAMSDVEPATLMASIAEYVAARHVPLLELASLPWASVVSTAVDTGVLDALSAAGTTRRLVELSAERIELTSGAHSPATLHLFQVLGRVGASGDLSPPNPQSLQSKLLLKLPRAADAIPQLLGTRGVLVIEGMSARAWLDESSWAVLGAVLGSVPAGRVFWFGWAPASLRAELGGVVFVDRRLTENLTAWAADDGLAADLSAGRDAVFGIDDHVFTVAEGKTRKTVRFSAKDWRELLRVGSTVDDAELDELCRLESESPIGGLARFAGRARVGVPDWASAARGYCFRRDATVHLVDSVVDYLSSAKQSLLDESGGGPMRRPLLLSGPPAIGKSVGLLRVGWELRRTHRAFVLWLLPGLSGIDTVQVERVVRMAESRGIPWVVLVVDGPLPDECSRVLGKLLSDGRRVMLLGSESTLDDENVQAPGHERYPIGLALSAKESSEWNNFLIKHGLEDPGVGGRDFLSRLNRVLPEAGYGSTAALLQEYERVIRAAQPSGEEVASADGPLAEKLRVFFPELSAKKGSAAPANRFDGDPFVREMMEMVLFCASADLPIAVDTMFVLLGSDLLNSFQRIQEAFESTALVQEVRLDNQGTVALATAHRLHAQWLLRALRPMLSSQLDVLRGIVNRVPWDLHAYPGDNPTQDYVIRILRQVGPRGGGASC